MSYVKAENVLPKHLVEEIQKYVDGKLLYIPRKNENSFSWGEKSGTRERLAKRNQTIVDHYNAGKTVEILSDAVLACEEDYMYEALDYSLSVKVVKNTEEAIAHIQKYSSGHSECIVTENHENAGKFIKQIDSAAVYVNASTRFTDGGEFGFGAEIGISTQKMHVRGPMGAKHLVSFKYVILGEGQTR